MIYHVLNRANARSRLFDDYADYAAFTNVLVEVVARTKMRLLAYSLMPNHFHLVLWPVGDGDLSVFMRILTLTHTQRWHASRHSAGAGHLYQGRFKSFPIQRDAHFLTVCRFVESNALRAGLADRAENWAWGSLVPVSTKSSDANRPKLTPWPIPRPRNWRNRVNLPLSPVEEEALGRSIRRNQPFGDLTWQSATAKRLGLESTFRPRGRPKKLPGNGA